MSETLGGFDAPKKSFCFSRSLLSVAAVLVLSGVCAHAEPASTGQSDGEKLERQMAADIRQRTGPPLRAEPPRAFNPFIQMEFEIARLKSRS